MAPDPITAIIAREGAVGVDRYMQLCLHHPEHGYYAARPSLGEDGDFITAPLISQMFGEVLGLWAVETWRRMGAPSRLILGEIGPGLGVMMSDMLRAARRDPAFGAAAEIWLVETSAPLRARQAQTLAGLAAPRWTSSLTGLPDGPPVILVGNELLDCLPIRQAVRRGREWRERRVEVGPDGALRFIDGDPVAPPDPPAAGPEGQIVEWSPAVSTFGLDCGRLAAARGGAVLMIDYGRDLPSSGDTLQALFRHRKESPLARPGGADLTAHADFPAWLEGAAQGGAQTHPVREQGRFLMALGLGYRAQALMRSRPDRAETIARQCARLVDPNQMGALFKAATVTAPGLTPPGFEDSHD